MWVPVVSTSKARHLMLVIIALPGQDLCRMAEPVAIWVSGVFLGPRVSSPPPITAQHPIQGPHHPMAEPLFASHKLGTGVSVRLHMDLLPYIGPSLQN